ncbi:MAG: tyrosine-protein phosphatase [Bacteroidales bacterium]|nr:tyrosine-protein phosphatase [Bacteroidales bacterium]
MNTPRAITIALIMTVTVSVSAQQFLPVKGINNARHLGGITVQDGRVVRDNMLIRSAHLADASDEDIDYLVMCKK